MDDRFKRCNTCGELKARTEFYVATGCADGLRGDCKACNRAASAERYRRNPEPARERARRWNAEHRVRYDERMREYAASGKKRIADRRSHLKRKYGLTVERYDELLAAQGGRCAICGEPPCDDVALHVDHCHDTGAVRGILCFRCNNAIGDLRHDVDVLASAIAYLSATEPDEPELALLARERIRALA